jgi:hypothetical protein
MVKVIAVGRPEVAPLEMPSRFRTDIAYFMTPRDAPGAPPLAEGEYWVRPDDARRWLDEMVFEVVSPLDAGSKAEVEVTDEQEAWLQWMVDHGVERIRVEG